MVNYNRRAIAEDNKDSIIQDRIDAVKKESESLKMGSVLKSEASITAVSNDKPATQEGQVVDDNFAGEVGELMDETKQ